MPTLLRYAATFAAAIYLMTGFAQAHGNYKHRVHRHHNHIMYGEEHQRKAKPKKDVDANGNKLYAVVHIANGQTSLVIASAKEKFQGFIDEVEAAGYKIADFGCKSSGHMRNSKHHWGGACDFDQDKRNVTAKFMYHVTQIAHKFGLTDGCTWNGPDCGHIEVPGPNSPYRNAFYKGSGGEIEVASRRKTTVMSAKRRVRTQQIYYSQPRFQYPVYEYASIR